MRMKHMLIEGYCNLDRPKEKKACAEFSGAMGVHCVGCNEFSYAKAPHEIAVSNECGVIETLQDFVALEDDFEVESYEKWRGICRNKIKEAYDEFKRS